MHSRRLAVLGTTLLAVTALGYAAWLRRPPSAETLLKQRVVEMARAVERQDVDFIVRQASADFHSDNGLTAGSLRQFLSSRILGARWLRVFIVDVQVRTLGAGSAEVSADVILGRSPARELKDLAKTTQLGEYRVLLRAEQSSDGEWRFAWARYQPAWRQKEG